MRYNKIIGLILILALIGGNAFASQKWVRSEQVYSVKQIEVPQVVVVETPKINNIINSSGNVCFFNKPEIEKISMSKFPEHTKQLHIFYRGETFNEIIRNAIHKNMTKQEIWYVTKEVEKLNEDKLGQKYIKPGTKIRIPKYRPDKSNRCCSDMRNIHVAVLKGNKYGVHWAYMIGVRTQENPSPRRDHFAYGVIIKKGTNLWTQAEWGAKILRRCTGSAAMNPSYAAIDRASHIYVGYEDSGWVENVYSVYKRCQGGV